MAFCEREREREIESSRWSEKDRVSVIWYSILKYICSYRIVPISEVNQLPFGDLVLVSPSSHLSLSHSVNVEERDTCHKIFIILHIDFIMETCQFIWLFFYGNFHKRVSVCACVCVCIIGFGISHIIKCCQICVWWHYKCKLSYNFYTKWG